MDTNTLAVIGAAVGSAKLVEQLLGPTANYIGEGIKLWTERRVINVQNIFRIAVRKLGSGINEEGAVPPRVLKGILDDGSFCDDALAAEYFGGVLASSRAGTPRDDRGVAFISVLAGLSTYQVRSHYFFYSLFRKHFIGIKLSTRYGNLKSSLVTVYVPFTAYSEAMELEPGENAITVAAHSLVGLQRQRLVSHFAYGQPPLLQGYAWDKAERMDIKEDGLIVSSSPFGAELFMYVHGKSDYKSENDFFSEEVKLESDAGIIIPDGPTKLTMEEKHLNSYGSLEGSY